MKTEINQEERWRKLLTDYKTANQTIKSFCELSDVHVHQFTYWRNKIEKGIVRKKKSKSSFIKITPVNNEQSNNDIPITIEVNKIKINIPFNFDALSLAKLIKVVRSID